MSAAKHTPGPWTSHGPAKATLDAPEGGDYCIKDGDGNIIAEAFYRVGYGVGGTQNAEENARLIAAAPELLEALKTTLGNIMSLGPACALDSVPMPYRVWAQVVHDAIAKAEGGAA